MHFLLFGTSSMQCCRCFLFFFPWVRVISINHPRRQGATRAGCQEAPLAEGLSRAEQGCAASPGEALSPSSASPEVGPGAPVPARVWALHPREGVVRAEVRGVLRREPSPD